MGEKTPEAIKVKCRGCDSRFRLTPKKGRLPTGQIPCPKCGVEIPVDDGEKVYASSDSDEEEASNKESSKPEFGVIPSSSSSKKTTDEAADDTGEETTEEEQAIADLERMADDMPSGSTMHGLPGVGQNNPFAKENEGGTTRVDPSVLERAAAESSEPSDAELAAESSAGDSSGETTWKVDDGPDTSPRLVSEDMAERLAQESSTAVDTSENEFPTDPDKPQRLRGDRSTEEQKVSPSELRKLAKEERDKASGDTKEKDGPPDLPVSASGDRPPRRSQSKAKSSGADDADSDSRSEKAKQAAKKAKKASSLLARIKTKKVKKSETAGASSKSSGETASSASKKDGDEPLSKLFKKVRDRRGAESGILRQKLKGEDTRDSSDPSTSKSGDEADLDIADEVEISEGELADIVDRTTGDSPPEDNAMKETAPAPESGKSDDTDSDPHANLFDEVDDPPTPSSDAGEVGEVSSERGKTTTQSMLARLQKKKNRGDNVDPLEVGAAGEARGSGYIRLPTAEIQDVLGQGNFRLKIEGVVYEPVDKEGLIQLIKGGVLLGAEQISEGNEDWMPVSKHPVFGELRRKMAAEAHQVLSRLGLDQKNADEPLEEPPAKDAPGPSRDTVPPEPPTTKEMNTSESDSLAATARSPDEPEEPETAEQVAPPPSEQPDTAEQDETPDAEEPEGKTLSPTNESEPAKPEPPETDAPAPDDGAAPPPEVPPTEAAPDEEPESDDKPEKDDKPEPAPPPQDKKDIEETGDEMGELDDQDFDDEPPPVTFSESGSKKPIAVVAVLAVVGLGAAGLLLTEPGQEWVEDTTGWTPLAPAEVPDTEAEELSPDPAVVEARSDATSHVGTSVDRSVEAISDSSQVDEWTRQKLENGAYDEAVAVMTTQWDDGRRDRGFLERFARALIDAEDFSTARRAAMAGIVEFPDDDNFPDLHRRALVDDEEVTSYDHVVLQEPSQYDTGGLYDVSDHRGIELQHSDDDNQILIFKPAREGWRTDWRAEIASWRFCELVICHFEIFEVQPAIMTREFADDVAGDSDELSALFARAAWETVELDGRNVDAVHGSLEVASTSAGTAFPIEYQSLWRGWLTAGNEPGIVDQPIQENLDRLETFAGGIFYDDLHAAFEDVTTGEVARSVSSLLIFDYLTNNWERFFTRTEEYGQNNPVIDSTIVSRHNGDAFQPRASRRVRGRFEWTTRFSQSTVATIRALDRELLSEILFPDATRAEERRLDVMWSQREAMLERVDELIARHGEDDVLLFP